MGDGSGCDEPKGPSGFAGFVITTDLTDLQKEDRGRGIDLVAIHGVRRCFHSGDITDRAVPFQGSLKTGDLSVRRISFAYHAEAIFHLEGLNQLARFFILGIRKLRQSTRTAGRSFVFIAQDYGGVILKQALSIAYWTSRYQDIVLDTTGIIFMDCPQRHDDIDGLGDKFLGLLEGIPRERLPGGSTGLANALAQSTTHANAEFLRTNLLARIQILNVLPSSKSHDLPAFEISDVIFGVGEVFNRTRLLREDLMGREFSSTVDFALALGRAHRALLSYMSAPIRLSPRACNWSSAQKDNITSHSSFREFMSSNQFCMLEVIARTGEANSFAAGHIFEYLDQRCSFREDLVLQFHFQIQDVRFNTARAMLQTIIAQVSNMSNIGTIVRTVTKRLEERGEDEIWTDDELYDLWNHVCKASELRSITLILGSLDECNKPSRDWFFSRLASTYYCETGLSWRLVISHGLAVADGGRSLGDELMQSFEHHAPVDHAVVASSDADGKPSTSGPVSSQQETRAQESIMDGRDVSGLALPVLCKLDLEPLRLPSEVPNSDSMHAPLVFRDSDKYPKCARLWAALGVKEEERYIIKEWIGHCFVEEKEEEEQEQEDEDEKEEKEEKMATALVRLPNITLAGVYKVVLDAIPETKHKWARTIMAFNALAFRRLTVKETQVISRLSYPEDDLSKDLGMAGDACVLIKRYFGGIFRVADGEFSRSAKLWEFLQGLAGFPEDSRPWYYFGSDASTHYSVLRLCLKYLEDESERLHSSLQEAARECQGPQREGAPSMSTFLAYAIRHWPDHYRAIVEETDAMPAAEDAVSEFLLKPSAGSSWLLAYESLTTPPARAAATSSDQYSPFVAAASLGFERLLERLGEKANQDTRVSAAAKAASCGHESTFRRIFNTLSGPLSRTASETIVLAAAASKDEKLLSSVLKEEKIRSNDAISSCLSRLVNLSARLGFGSVMKVLLRAQGYPVPKTDAIDYEPLRHAIERDDIETVKTLKTRGHGLFGYTVGNDNLELAIEYGSGRVAAFFLESNMDLRSEYGRERSKSVRLFQIAIRRGFARVLNSLIQCGNFDDYMRNSSDDNPLVMAATHGKLKCAKLILESSAGRAMEKSVLEEALLASVDNGNLGMAGMLIESGVDVVKACRDSDLVDRAMLSKEVGLFQLLINKGLEVDGDFDFGTPLTRAARRGCTEVAKLLVGNGANVDKRSTSQGFTGTPVYFAAYFGHTETLELLLNHGADPNTEVEETTAWRPIHAAYDNAAATRLLLRFGADRNKLCNMGTPLLLAARYDYPKVVEALLEDDDSQMCDLEAMEGGHTALTAALHHGSNTSITLRLLDAGANPNRSMNAGNYPLHVAVLRGDEALVDKLLQCRAKLDERGEEGSTALNLIGKTTPFPIVRALVNAGADVEIPDSAGYTPIWKALREGHSQTFRYLLRRGANINYSAGTGITNASSFGNVTGSSASMAGAISMLQWACMNSDRKSIESILSVGAVDVNIEIPGFVGTALQAICMRSLRQGIVFRDTNSSSESSGCDETIAVLKLLLNKGAVLNRPRPPKGTLGHAINAACLFASGEVVKFLVREHRANVAVRDSPANRSPLHLACYRSSNVVDAVLFDAQPVGSSGEISVIAVDGGGAERESAESNSGDGTVLQNSAATATATAATASTQDMSAGTIKASDLLSARDVTGRLPLHYAAATGRPNLILHVLAKYHLTPNSPDAINLVNDQDAQGWTPLHWAARDTPILGSSTSSLDAGASDETGTVDRAATIQILTSFGADLTIRAAKGVAEMQAWTPFTVASFYGASQEVLDALTFGPQPHPTSGTSRSSSSKKMPLGRQDSQYYCDCCLMGVIGKSYHCMACNAYILCFKCFLSRDVLHPAPHGKFDEVGRDFEDPDAKVASEGDEEAEPDSSDEEIVVDSWDDEGGNDGPSPDAGRWSWERNPDGSYSFQESRGSPLLR